MCLNGSVHASYHLYHVMTHDTLFTLVCDLEHF